MLDQNGQPRKKVLLVEDHAAYREMLRDALAHRFPHFQLFEGRTAAEGLCLLGQHEFDLIITDASLPDGSARDMVKFISNNRAPRPPLIILSNYSVEDCLPYVAGIECYGIVPKELGFQEVMRAIEKVGRGESYLPSPKE